MEDSSAKDIVDQYYTSIGGHPSKPVSKPVSSKTEAKPVRAKGRPSAAKDGSSEDEHPVQKKKPGRPPKRVKEADDEEVDEKRTKRARSTSKAASPGKPKSNGVAHEAVKQVEEDDLDDDDDDEEALRKMRAKEEREQKKLDAILKSFKGDWEVRHSHRTIARFACARLRVD